MNIIFLLIVFTLLRNKGRICDTGHIIFTMHWYSVCIHPVFTFLSCRQKNKHIPCCSRQLSVHIILKSNTTEPMTHLFLKWQKLQSKDAKKPCSNHVHCTVKYCPQSAVYVPACYEQQCCTVHVEAQLKS